jgi:hypothetical protein
MAANVVYVGTSLFWNVPPQGATAVQMALQCANDGGMCAMSWPTAYGNMAPAYGVIGWVNGTASIGVRAVFRLPLPMDASMA